MGGRTFVSRALSFERQFQFKIWARGDCWEWRGRRTAGGYGEAHDGREALYAHRVAYEHAKGSIPVGLEIDHLCRHPWCVRPSHLEAVTHRVNDIRGVTVIAQNARKTHCKHGHPLDGPNLRLRKGGTRGCRACDREWAARRPRLER